MRTYTAGTGQMDLETHCLVTSALVSVLPVPPDPVPAPPIVPRTRDADGLGAHLVIRMGGHSVTQDEQLLFGADPGTYRLRRGWKAFIGGGDAAIGTNYVVRQWEIDEPLPFTQRFLLSVIARDDRLITWPTFGGPAPAPYTFIRVVRGVVLDETGIALPLGVDWPLTGYFRGSRDALYFLGLDA